ncbi:hypothetical protein [Streptomyces fructofermentans]|uniref:Uncharacterized protein n=1 Tax=Streptomyces fructofermentans TaxID=152141 RepID=A0A918N5Q5_9ACTN|nr:hypothetical protein [Streptomyces fructofermentans]GGX39804.1 hypothetical protein GCM10010515_02940 [Streptomyces fructofermentans]
MTVTKNLEPETSVKAERTVRKWAATVSSRMRGRERDAGAGFVEYAGLMILIAGIFTLIDGLGLDGLISGAILDAVNQVIGG